jgi:hypothetical protein
VAECPARDIQPCIAIDRQLGKESGGTLQNALGHLNRHCLGQAINMQVPVREVGKPSGDRRGLASNGVLGVECDERLHVVRERIGNRQETLQARNGLILRGDHDRVDACLLYVLVQAEQRAAGGRGKRREHGGIRTLQRSQAGTLFGTS